MATARRFALGVLPALLVAAGSLVGAVPVQAYSCATVPVGQANPSAEVEPLLPVWCLGSMAAEPTTRQLDPWGGWQDAFQTNVQVGHLNNGDMGYRVFDGVSNGADVKTRHFVNNNHWMVDSSHDNGGAAMSPAQAFHFENGKLVIEADVAAGVPGYVLPKGGDIVWPEVEWSTSSAPTSHFVDGAYLYGHLGGWTGGCRLSAARSLTCALLTDHTLANTTDDKPPCFSSGPRVIEMSGFQYCGTQHTGFAVDFGASKAAWRQCQPNQMDMYCRDRFRFEWSADGFVAYVNGVLFAQDTGWPGYAQIPQSIVTGKTPVHAYFGEWGDFSDPSVYRFHWGRVAVNPHDASGALLPPSVAPSYCPGQAQSTCAMGTSAPGSAPISMPAMPAMPAATPKASAPAGAMPGMGANTAHAQTHAFLASALNGGQQPMFWIVLGVMLAGGAAVGAVMWLWTGGPRRT